MTSSRLERSLNSEDSAYSGRPANAEMVLGYREGFNLDNPEPSENRSHSYRHGFEVGRADKMGRTPSGTFEQVIARAEEAMRKDEMI